MDAAMMVAIVATQEIVSAIAPQCADDTIVQIST
jgi:hypothetical protein